MKKKHLILRIVFVSIYLVVSTFVFYMPKREQLAAAMSYLTTIDKLNITEVTNGIILEKSYPVKDEVGVTLKDTVFTVNNDNNHDVTYRISIDGTSNNTFDLTNLKYIYKINDGKYSDIKNVSSDGIIDIKELDKNTKNTYYIKFWVDYNSSNEIYGKRFEAIISLAKVS